MCGTHYKINAKKNWNNIICIRITFKKKLIAVTVLRPTQVSEYQCTKVYEGTIFKELGKFTL